jgi:uncharacterized phage protein (TIGR01671 family)
MGGSVMREIKFRGKRIDNGEWVYGAFVPDELERTHGEMVTWGFIRRYKPNQTVESVEMIEVDRKTVGQYTGLKDKNGKEIYEGDKVNCWGGECCQGYWEFNNTIVVDDIRDYVISGILSESEYIEVIGNIHENKELLQN